MPCGSRRGTFGPDSKVDAQSLGAAINVLSRVSAAPLVTTTGAEHPTYPPHIFKAQAPRCKRDGDAPSGD